MRSTLTLIQREIEDYAILYVLAAIVSCGTAMHNYWEYGPIHPQDSHEMPQNVLGMLLFVVSGLAALAVTMGCVQTALDRVAGVSSFLVTLSPTRAQIFRAKCLAGLLWIVLGLLPIFLVHMYTLNERDLDTGLLGSLLGGSFLLLLASYSLGLRIGLMTRKWALLVALALLMALLMLPAIMGLGMHCFLLLLLVSLCLMLGAGSRFKTLAL